MTTLRDILRDFQQETISKSEWIGRMTSQDEKEQVTEELEALIDVYIEDIKERIIG